MAFAVLLVCNMEKVITTRQVPDPHRGLPTTRNRLPDAPVQPGPPPSALFRA